MVIGGDRVPETLNCLSEAIFKADKVIVGGLPAYTLLAARGHSLGSTHVDKSYLDRAAGLIRAARNQVRCLSHTCSSHSCNVFPSRWTRKMSTPPIMYPASLGEINLLILHPDFFGPVPLLL